MKANWEIRVRGLVQGVGFRPYVWRLAKDARIFGEVLNDSEGVIIRLACGQAQLIEFTDKLSSGVPPLARIDALEISRYESSVEWEAFNIAASKSGKITTSIVPDAATCDDCLDEIFDPTNRRFLYPFTNCTNCGPRLSITREIPYDRANTSMARFEMCSMCQSEYEDPLDRRFHAQPNACPACGPQLKFISRDGKELPGDPITNAALALKAGSIVAIKGVGGFQLAVDASNAIAIEELRVRKWRASKPFALMARDKGEVQKYCTLNQTEIRILESPAAPIVLAKAAGQKLAANIAPDHNRLGFMLPNTPLHHLLLAKLEVPIVLTSGNHSSEPQITENHTALEKLNAIADYWLEHDRDIVNRLDDSVVQVIGNAPQVIRRARGNAPTPLRLHDGFHGRPPVLAMGADLKNTFCLLSDGQAIVSQHIGDLGNAETQRDLHSKLALYRRIHGFDAEVIAADQHLGYFSTRIGQDIAKREGLETVNVQHHHAHVCAALAEHGYGPEAKPVLGVALDGLGYGDDGTFWGGEFLLADFRGYKRLAKFKPVPLLGADKANTQPWRNSLAHLLVAFGPDALEALQTRYGSLPFFIALAKYPTELLTQMFTRNVNAPLSSSAGRLFDAVAAMLGICFDQVQYEGQAAIQLQNIAEGYSREGGFYPVLPAETIEWRPLWEGILGDLKAGLPDGQIAKRFHNTLIRIISLVATEIVRRTDVDTVVLAGGVFQNSLLLSGVSERLSENNLTPLMPSHFPTNDGAVSLGQAAIAAAKYT